LISSYRHWALAHNIPPLSNPKISGFTPWPKFRRSSNSTFFKNIRLTYNGKSVAENSPI
jgi:hypothetical protein